MKKTMRRGGAFVLLAGAVFAMGPGQENEAAAAEPVLELTVAEDDLFPESVAWDPVSESWFLSSMGHSRILRVRKEGAVEDFVFGAEDGLVSSIGMKIDAKRRVLWVCTGRFSLYEAYDEVPAKTGLLAYDIDKAELLQAWLLPQASDYHIFNDVALNAAGEAYVTTTLLGRVYKATRGKDELELVLQLPAGRDDNGITLGPDEKHLFLTVGRSVHRLELATGELVAVTMPAGEGIGVDGLYYHRGWLVAIIPRANRVVRYRLNEDLTAVIEAETLVHAHPRFVYPTTGVVVGDRLVVLATSFADRPRKPDAEEQHGDVLLFGIPLAR